MRAPAATHHRRHGARAGGSPAPAPRATSLGSRRIQNAENPARQGLGRAHGRRPAERPDAALHRPAPDPRGHQPAGLRRCCASWACRCASRSAPFATVDHIIPTDSAGAAVRRRPGRGDDDGASSATAASSASRFFDRGSGHQGIVHVIGPELGLTQPGMTIACGDCHTSTHGAFGAIAFGIGTSQVRDVLAPASAWRSAPEGAPHRGDGAAAAGRLRQGRDPAHHPHARREGRRRLRLRVRRHGHRRA